MSKTTKAQDMKVMLGLDKDPGLDPSVIDQIVEAAIRAAEKAAAKAHGKAQAEQDELKKWEGLAQALDKALTDKQRKAICGTESGSIRLWYNIIDGSPVLTDWKAFTSRANNKAGGSNTVYYHDVDKGQHVEFVSGEALCQYLGLDTNGNSATRILEANKIPFTRTMPTGRIVKAK